MMQSIDAVYSVFTDMLKKNGNYEDGDYYKDGRNFYCNIVCSCDSPEECERARYSWFHEGD